MKMFLVFVLMAVKAQDVDLAPLEKLSIKTRQTRLYAVVSPKLRIEVRTNLKKVNV